VASINALQRISSESQSAVAMLFILRLLPSVIVSGVGGVLADMVDRRRAMIALDVCGALAVLLYIPVVAYGKSLAMLYVVVLLQATIAALYDPVRQAILPMLVTTEAHLKLAITLTGIIWSSIAAVGAFIGGVLVTHVGVNACFGKKIILNNLESC
jgi:MFS family permease